ncbi:MAG TPA: tetraacyldisaccharide 4'-kinase [Burkholderiaceae bacterium]|nr:tetraacyldisaccharide 4'-kinase [Burkholderiaceae bacterium]
MQQQIHQTLQQAWLTRGWLSILLLPLSALYGALAWLHRHLYLWGILKKQRVAVPVIVVGNIVAGGGGKTPTVMALVDHLKAKGWQVGVVSRGYGRDNDICTEVLPHSSVAQVGDEPLLLANTCQVPVFVATKRFDAASQLLAKYPATNIIISDDGLQHHALHHDVAIMVLDDRGVGNGWLLPAGPLRETLRDKRLRAQNNLVLHTGNHPVKIATTAPQFTAKRSLAQQARRHDGSRVNLADLNEMATRTNKPLVALAGIANPESFFAMLREIGLQLSQTIALPDHYSFDSKLGNEYAGYSLICTDKDAVKLWQTAPHALAVGLEFVPEPAFFTQVDTLLAALKSSTSSSSN